MLRVSLYGLCVVLDVASGLTWVVTPALVYEWLYPELVGRGALSSVEQGGWLLLSRGVYSALYLRDVSRWGPLWWVSAPLNVWSLAALSHLGAGGGYWHGLQLVLSLALGVMAYRGGGANAHKQRR